VVYLRRLRSAATPPEVFIRSRHSPTMRTQNTATSGRSRPVSTAHEPSQGQRLTRNYPCDCVYLWVS